MVVNEPESEADDGRVTVLLGASSRFTVAPGSTVLVEESEGDSYGAVIVKIVGCEAFLTFTPVGRPRKVSLGAVVCCVGDGSDTLDLSSIPEYQPAPTVVPYRSRRVVVNSVPSMW